MRMNEQTWKIYIPIESYSIDMWTLVENEARETTAGVGERTTVTGVTMISKNNSL